MGKSPDAFRSIGEVARLVGVAPHVLRYWEGQFPQLSPVKRADGRRYYRPEDVQLAAGLCEVMREEGLTIRGAKRLIAADRGAGLRSRGAARLNDSAALTFEAAGGVEAVPLRLNAAPKMLSRRNNVVRPAPANRHEVIVNAGAWLHRLNRMAGRLRDLPGPLPAEARAVAQDLRGLLDRR